MARAMVRASTIASNICEDLGDATNSRFTHIMKKVVLGYKSLHLLVDKTVSIKTVILESSSGNICLPKDFVYETKIGVMRGGRIVTLGIDPSLRAQARPYVGMQVGADQLESLLSGPEDASLPLNCFYNCYEQASPSACLGELYGYSAGFHPLGYYNIDRSAGEIALSSLIAPGDQLIIEYKSDGVSDGLTLIPSEMERAVMYFAKAEYYADKNPSQSQLNMAKYEQQHNLLKRIYNQKPVDYLASLIQEVQRPAPR